PPARTLLQRQRRQGRVTLHPPQREGDLSVHLFHLPQGELPGLVGQLPLEEVLLPVRSGQGLGDLRRAGLPLLVAVRGSFLRRPCPTQDRPEDGPPGDTRKVAE